MVQNNGHIVIGMGEIGQAIYQVIGPCLAYDKDEGEAKFDQKYPAVPVMHIAIPYTENFIKEVMKYKKRYKSELVIIYSTVPVGTTKQLGEGFVHSPVEGKHPYLKRSILLHTRWVGSTDNHALKRAANLWANVVNKVQMLPDSDFTEFLKLRSTSRYGINIAFARYEKEVADKIGMDWNSLMEFDRDYNELYRNLDLPDLQRYVLKAPEGPIGGHCIVPNADLLNEQYPNKMLENIK